jgi:hypothetical protein
MTCTCSTTPNRTGYDVAAAPASNYSRPTKTLDRGWVNVEIERYQEIALSSQQVSRDGYGEGKIKANRCLLPSVCLHVVFRIILLQGVPSSAKSASNSMLRPALTCWGLNVAPHCASCPAWPRTRPRTSAQEPVAFAIAAAGQAGGRGRFSTRLWLPWPRRTADDCRHPCGATDDVR